MFGSWKNWGKIGRKMKNKFKVNKLFLYVSLNLFTYFSSCIQRLNNSKMHKFLTVKG